VLFLLISTFDYKLINLTVEVKLIPMSTITSVNQCAIEHDEKIFTHPIISDSSTNIILYSNTASYGVSLGRGSFSTVYNMEDRRTNLQVAAKLVDKIPFYPIDKSLPQCIELWGYCDVANATNANAVIITI